jgi:hypothetical protein
MRGLKSARAEAENHCRRKKQGKNRFSGEKEAEKSFSKGNVEVKTLFSELRRRVLLSGKTLTSGPH